MVRESERSETSGGSSEEACLTCLPPHVIGTGRLDALHSGAKDATARAGATRQTHEPNLALSEQARDWGLEGGAEGR